jgi:two-component system, chemotaxis family, sensor kinase CheA
MSTMNSIRDTFFEECEDLLTALSDGLAVMQSGAHDSETVNAVFRAVHSIKGGAGAFKLSDLVAFAHRFETVLDELRANRLSLVPDLLFTLLRSADHLTVLVEAARAEEQVDPQATEGFVSALNVWLNNSSGSAVERTVAPDESFSFAPVILDFQDLGAGDDEQSANAAITQKYLISFWPKSTLFANGHEPAFLLDGLAQMGHLEATLNITKLPPWDQFDPSIPFIGWQLTLDTAASEAEIKSVFEFVDGLCDLQITLHTGESTLGAAINSQATSVQLSQPAIEKIMAAPIEQKPISQIEPNSMPTDTGEATVPQQTAAPAKQQAVSGPPSSEANGPKPTLRVDLDRVDRLINAVGELIINQAMIAQRVAELPVTTDSEVVTYVEDYRLLARDIQEAVMAIRAQPVKPLFQRMSRIVREAADATGKSAQLLSFGEEIEVDKTVIERLADPLTHMIRNAVDHGLESREDRIRAGKDICGIIKLSAAHRSGRVIITIKDDGAGLNRPRILKIAKDKGLIPADAELADSDIDSLLFLPGFSTASKISNLSGRGVGLDVVRTAVTALGGRVSISSTPGLGTEFTISLPLTLAVMDGMIVSVNGQTMVAPISSILETIRPTPSELHNVGPNSKFLSIGSKFIPIVDVAASLGLDGGRPENETPLLLLVESENENQCALIVDEVHDQRQVVIKGLEHNFRSVAGVSAATVLGNGHIALILDLDAIAFQRTSNQEPSAELAVNAKGV